MLTLMISKGYWELGLDTATKYTPPDKQPSFEKIDLVKTKGQVPTWQSPRVFNSECEGKKWEVVHERKAF